MILQDFDPVSIVARILKEKNIHSKSSQEGQEVVKEEFINCLLEKFSKEEGKKIAPYLSDIVFHKKTKTTEFSICTENVSVRFEFKHDF